MIIEQSKILAYLAVAFIIASALVHTMGSPYESGNEFIYCEMAWFLSLVCSYVVVGSVAGQVNLGKEDINRTSTRWLSVFQLLSCGIGFMLFVIMLV